MSLIRLFAVSDSCNKRSSRCSCRLHIMSLHAGAYAALCHAQCTVPAVTTPAESDVATCQSIGKTAPCKAAVKSYYCYDGKVAGGSSSSAGAAGRSLKGSNDDSNDDGSSGCRASRPWDGSQCDRQASIRGCSNGMYGMSDVQDSCTCMNHTRTHPGAGSPTHSVSHTLNTQHLISCGHALTQLLTKVCEVQRFAQLLTDQPMSLYQCHDTDRC